MVMLRTMNRYALLLTILASLVSDSHSWLSPEIIGRHGCRNDNLPTISGQVGWTHSKATTRRFASEWIDLTADGGVQKSVKQPGIGASAGETGKSVTIDYTGTLAPTSWSVDEVIRCWLSEQQGLDDVADAFREKQVDESKLIDPLTFNEDFVTNELRVTAKIKCKKLVMAAKRLATTRKEFEVGTKFDSNSKYEIVLGKKKLIRGMEMVVSSMQVGEVSQAKIRSDYAYGAEGYRKSNGEVVVPPFSTLLFEIKLLS